MIPNSICPLCFLLLPKYDTDRITLKDGRGEAHARCAMQRGIPYHRKLESIPAYEQIRISRVRIPIW